MNDLEQKKFLFGTIFLLANKLQTLGDKHLQGNITTKQWFLTVSVSQFLDYNPSLSEVAETMGSSRQNVKQLALKLHKKNYLQFVKQKDDSRITALKLTKEYEQYWSNRKTKDQQFILDLFEDLSVEELNVMHTAFNKLVNKLKILNNEKEF